jgi:hypothetical protein
MPLAPIILFCFNRPENTKNTLEALSQNNLANQSILIIYCDGPKKGTSDKDLKLIEEVRALVDKEQRFKKVKVIKRSENMGLANSIITGVTDVVNEYGSVIVLEDDILCSKYFLDFMNESLGKYKNNSKVFSIGACNYFAIGKDIPESFALPVADCLGWATWKNRWDLFESDSQKLITQIEEKDLVKEFSLLGYYDFFGMLKLQSEGKINSWAIRWQAVIFLNNMLTIYPNPSVTQHVESSNATHASINILPMLANEKIQLTDDPVILNEEIFKKMLKGYFTELTNKSIRNLLLNIKFAIKSSFDKEIKKYVDKINTI